MKKIINIAVLILLLLILSGWLFYSMTSIKNQVILSVNIIGTIITQFFVARTLVRIFIPRIEYKEPNQEKLTEDEILHEIASLEQELLSREVITRNCRIRLDTVKLQIKEHKK